MNRRVATLVCLVCALACGKRRVAATDLSHLPEVVRFSEPEALATLDAPRFVPAAASGYADDEPVLGLVDERGVAKAYSLRALERRPVVNDTLAVVFDPVSGAASAWRRAGLLGVTGLLYRDALVVHDRDSDALYSSLTGEALDTGGLPAPPLVEWPAVRTEWGWWRALHPATQALVRDESGPSLAASPEAGTLLDGLDASAWVVAVRMGNEAFAVPLDGLEDVVNTRVGDVAVAVVGVPAGAVAFLSPALTSFGTQLADAAGRRFSFDGAALSGPAGRLAAPASVRVTRWGPWKRALPATVLGVSAP